MILELDFHCGVPIYRQIMDQVRRAALTGQMVSGEQVESVKCLASRLKVNPMTVSKAYGYLVEEGLLERRRGVGLFVRTVRKDVKRRRQEHMLGEAMAKLAELAVQLEIPERDALEMLSQEFRRLETSKKANRS